ncbi:hypothetical protein BS47DRAFT_1300664, partial [Hydnum rufescens UP504]
KGSVVKEGKAGYKCMWPKFITPQAGNSHAPCPHLNALVNHRILPRDGQNITKEMFQKVLEDTFNFSPTLMRNTTPLRVSMDTL